MKKIFSIPIRSILTSLLTIAFVISSTSSFAGVVYAASLTSMSDVQTDLTEGALSSHDITFVTPSGIDAGETITLSFDNGTSISASLDTPDVSLSVDSAAQTVTVGANDSSTWGFVRTSSSVITISAQTSGTPAAAGATIRIGIGTVAGGTNRITNGTAGTTILTIGGTFGDSGMIGEAVVSDSIVNITATVTPTITFELSDNTIGFGTLSSTNARYASGDTNGSATDTVAHTMSIATNAPGGYSISIQGATLTSGSYTIDAIGGSAASSSPGTEQFGIYATESGGTNNSVTSKYSDDVTPMFAYAATDVSSDTLGVGTSATDTATYSVHYIANISGSTEPGSYVANIVYVATPQY